MEVPPTDMEGVVEEAPQREEAPAPVQQPGSRVSPFTFQPAVVLADLVNMALEMCADAFDRFEEAIAGLVQLPEAERKALIDGINVLYEFAKGSLDQAGTNFQRLAEATILRVPPELYLEQAAAATPAAVSSEEEAALDAELEQLRAGLAEAKAGCGGLQRQLRDLTRDLAAANAAPSLEPLASALATGREGLLDDAGQVAAALAELGPLLARARGALAVREGGGPAGAKAPSASDAAAGAQRRITAAQADTGASADQLQALASSLTTSA